MLYFDRYPNRPDELEQVSLYDFGRLYDVATPQEVKTRKDLIELGCGFGYLKLRKSEALISHNIPNKSANTEEYYRTFLLLFKPWRSRTDVLYPSLSCKEAFFQDIEHYTDMKAHEEKIGIHYDRINEMNESAAKEEEVIAEEEDQELEPQHVHFSEEVMNSVTCEFQELQQDDGSDYITLFNEFNVDQKRVFLKIVERLHAQNPSVDVPLQIRELIDTSNQKPLFMFISGLGGSGKSYVIRTLALYVRQIFKLDVSLSAPTGVAASNINGMTVHRALQLPVQHGSTPKYQSLSNENFHQSYAMLKNAGLFIIDEISMISNVMLTYIHKRLQEIFGVFDHIFGSRNVVVFGDLLQLTSVTHDSCFADFAKAEIELLNSISSVNIWKEVEYDELTINMRQRGDDRFQKILNDVRLGFILPEDEAFLTEK